MTARAVPSSRSASSGTTVSSTDCATPGTMNRPRKIAVLRRDAAAARVDVEVAETVTAGHHRKLRNAPFLAAGRSLFLPNGPDQTPVRPSHGSSLVRSPMFLLAFAKGMK